MLKSALERAVAFSARKPLIVLCACALLALVAMLIAAARFDMNTDTGVLISAETDWRRNDAIINAAFPRLKDSIVVVVDGQTPELAQDGAERLAAALAEDSENFHGIRRPDGGEFFDRHGLLFGSVEEVRETTATLIEAQPLLGGLAYDPSLRGIADTLATVAAGAAEDPSDPSAARLAEPLAKLDAAISDILADKRTSFSWQQFFASGDGALAPSTRQIILAEPRLDFGALQPGARAVAAVRGAASMLGLDAAYGVRVGITGEVPLADEEFGSIEESMGLIGALMAAAMLVTLWFATQSKRTVFAIALTIVTGLVISLAVGLLAVGALNIISVAFIPLFVGLGVDFGIQVSVRFNAERREGAGLAEALERAADAVGAPILLAAGAICLALGAFLPTDYIGIAELGVISGLGMVIALVLNLTLLPALLMVLKPPPPPSEVGFSRAAPLDRWLERNRRGVLWAFAAAMAASIALLPFVRFDFNPLHLRDPDAPAMRMLGSLMRDPQRTPNTLNILAPDIDAANRLAARLSRLPEVRNAITADSFVPQDQSTKLPLIEDAALLLDPAINPFDFPPPDGDAATVAALRRAADELGRLGEVRQDRLGTEAARLSRNLARLAQSPPGQRERTSALLVAPLEITLNRIRSSLQPGEVTRGTLPAEITADWIASDGRALVQVVPSGDSTDNVVLKRFTMAVRRIAPGAVGFPVATQEAARTVSHAFVQAGILALVLVCLLLFAVLRSVREVVFTMTPVVLSGFLTLGTCVVIGQPLNFANIIAFPLLFGVGVAFHIYFVMAWRRGVGDLLQTSLARAVLFSALATGSAFGALWFSHHPGTASMGLILMISLVWTLVCALIFEPALLGPQRPGAVAQE